MLGPEQVFHVSLKASAANFGVAITGGAASVEPRVVRNADENQLTGEIGLPFNANPYLPAFGTPNDAAGAALPVAGEYDVVFDSAAPTGGGAFTFRFWIGDTTPPHLKLISTRGRQLRARATDAGSGVDPALVRLFVDGKRRAARYSAGQSLVTASLRGLARGRHRFILLVSDYQETKNMENVRKILPNTARLRGAFRIR
jgi:hypothetical protein